jgi:histidine triad (HIT) family protein
MGADGCIFCKIVRGEAEAFRVHEDDGVIVFLDMGPLFAGHALVCPKRHYDTLMDVPSDEVAHLFTTTQLVARAVENGLGAEGSLIAINNRISQSVPHVHVHVIPRRRGDGLKGFFWPRRPYRDREHALETQTQLRAAITYLLSHD